ncbi:hypothetical protein O181_104275 [Austropuccinia psidii MF-1]|uniref:Uncharacterized protein n=1 Tax=Austropuccinia psidii MF-1 TaxID=1389203 RepID=A0A9Q3PKI8_9BASI|nr:hypothetical protein [Austropuccinia psidii MF-1]
MLLMLQKDSEGIRDFSAYPHPLNKWVLSQFAMPLRSIPLDDANGSISVMAPNNVVIFKNKGALEYGLVKAIYSFHGPKNTRVIGIYIHQIHSLYKHPRYPPGHVGYCLALFGVVVGKICPETSLMIRSRDVVSLGAYRLFESGIFRAPSNGIMLCPFNCELSLF